MFRGRSKLAAAHAAKHAGGGRAWAVRLIGALLLLVACAAVFTHVQQVLSFGQRVVKPASALVSDLRAWSPRDAVMFRGGMRGVRAAEPPQHPAVNLRSEGAPPARSQAEAPLASAFRHRWTLCNTTAASVDSSAPKDCGESDEPDRRFLKIGADVPTPPDVTCFWTNMTYDRVLPRPLRVCTHDPTVDTTIARNLHAYNMWESSGMVVTIKRLVKAGVICTRERPFVVDLGMNIGVYTLIFLELGCHVVSFEPLGPNLFRARESARANGLEERLTLYKNGVSNREAPLFIKLNAANPGASDAHPFRSSPSEECVMSVALDGLFSRPDRPVSPTTGAPFVPSEISFLKVDIEGFDTAAYDGMQSVLLAGHPIPFTTMEYNQPMAAAASGCWGEGVLHMMSELGYAFWDHHDTPLDGAALLAAADATSERLPKGARVGVAPSYEMWMQHSSVGEAAGLKLELQLA